MRHTATFVVALTVLVAPVSPVAHADPMTPQDHYYTKYLSEYGVNYQGRVSLQMMIANAHTTCAMIDQSPTPQTLQAAIDRLAGGPGNFTNQEAKLTAHAAINSYCSGHSNLIYS